MYSTLAFQEAVVTERRHRYEESATQHRLANHMAGSGFASALRLLRSAFASGLASLPGRPRHGAVVSDDVVGGVPSGPPVRLPDVPVDAALSGHRSAA